MRLRISEGVFGLSILVVAAVSGSSCILGDNCILVHEKGVQWRATVTGSARMSSNTSATISGDYLECRNKKNDAILQTEDESDPLYVALFDAMVAKAAVDCVMKAEKLGYLDIKCDPFDEDQVIVVTLTRLDVCDTSELTVAKGQPSTCLQGAEPGSMEATTEEMTAATTMATTTVPTTTQGDAGATTGDDSGATTGGDSGATTGGDSGVTTGAETEGRER